MIVLTVALPIFNSKKIAWLALESLCNQKNITFEWELIIMEEQGVCFGIDEVKKYIDRLKKVGCKSVRYVPLEYRISLPKKWRAMADMRASTSIVYLLQAADCYSEPNRLRMNYDKVKEGYEWIHNKRGYFYNINLKKTIEYNALNYQYPTHLNMAVACSILDRLPYDVELPKGIDRWFYSSVKPERVYECLEEVLGGVDTDGYNNISVGRKSHFENPKDVFVATDKKIEDIIPKNILKRLNEL